MFSELIKNYVWQDLSNEIYAKTNADVERALRKPQLDLDDFKALVSPSASNYLEQMAARSKAATQKRFGKTIQLYIPLYLTNTCINHCVYCGFNHTNKINRIILTDDKIKEEIDIIKKMGYEHILLVTGESPKEAGIDYIENAVKLVRPHFESISLEVQPLEIIEYERLIQSGLNAVYIYQETYNKERYRIYHPKGIKSDFEYRLHTPDRLGQAKIHKIGLGALMGLEDFRVESFFLALHLRYLQKTYWRTKYSISFPRIRPHEGVFQPNYPVNDKEFAQMIWAFRLFDNDVEIALSTRESPQFRDHMIELGVTSMSAGSKTDPGGYSNENIELEQFSVNDNRSPEEIIKSIHNQGYDVVWKDWDKIFG